MDPSILFAYLWVLVVLIVLEGLLAADNAIVMAVMVKHLEPEKRKKALFYGLIGAFIFRIVSLFMISILANYWEIQALGAAYLIFMSIKNLRDYFKHKDPNDPDVPDAAEEQANDTKGNGFWMTVLKVELADIAFAIDSMLAAIAIAVTLPHLGPDFLGMNVGQFAVMFTGGMIGVILMRFAANYFVAILAKYPALEAAAFTIVGWVGIKLVVLVLAHEKVHLIPHDFPHSLLWQIIFWSVLLGIVLVGILRGRYNERKSH